MENKELQKTLGISAALSTVVGMVIGAGVFFKPQAVYSLTGGAPGLGIMSWVVAGIITIAAGLTTAEVSAAIPKTGGMMVYIQEIYGEKLGFLTGWMQTVLFFPGMVAALAVVFAEQATALIEQPGLLLPIAVAVIMLVAFLNTLGSKTGGAIQTVATVCKLIPLILIMIFGFIKGSGENAILTPMVAENVNFGSAVGQVLIAILFAYDGWINVGAIAGEMKNPGKDLPKAIVGGLSLVMAVYFVVNLAYLWVLPANELATFSAPAAAVAEIIFGEVGGKIITVGILISVFGALNGFVLTGSRVAYTLACEKTLPGYKKLSKLNKAQVPAASIILVCIIGSLYALSGQFNLLTDLSVFAAWIFYILTFMGVMKLRKEKPDLERPYRVPLYPVIPLLAIFSGSFVLINQLFFAGMKSSLISVGGIIVTLIGLPVYNAMSKKVK